MEKGKFYGTRAIIFDKDGTLLDFDAFWVSVGKMATDMLLSRLGALNERKEITDETLLAYGICGGVTDIDGVICKGTYRQMSDIFCDVLAAHGVTVDGDELYPMLLSAYGEAAQVGVVLPTAEGLREALLSLRSRGIKLFLVTTDKPDVTKRCLDSLEITELFDRIYCDDGIMPPKPAPDAIDDVISRFGIDRDGIIMVGDTMTDVRFARGGGIRVIGVSANEKNAKRLRPHADAVIHDVTELLSVIGD